MKNLISLAGALLLLALMQLSGMFSKFSLSHPFWETKATLIGAGIGIAIALVLFIAIKRSRSIMPMLTTLVMVLLVICTGVTWYFARVFINSEVFEPLAGKIWFFGYHGLVALFVLVVAMFIRRFLPMDKT